MDLRHYLFENQVTSTAFAKQIGVTPIYVGQMKKGKRPLLWIAQKMIEVSNGQITPQDIYPELFETYEKAMEKK